jgi:cytochrome P450
MLSPIDLVRWLRRPMQLFDDYHARFGDVFSFRLRGVPGSVVVVADPDAVRDVFAEGHETMHAGEANAVLKPFMGEQSLILLDDQPHVRQRKLLMPPFHGERMQQYGREMIAQTEASIDRWPVGSPFSIQSQFRAVTLQIILRTVFGLEEGPRLQRLSALLARTLDAAEDPFLLLPPLQIEISPRFGWGRFKHGAREVDTMLFEEIARRRQEGTKERTDILSLLLDARDESGEAMTDVELRDELVTLLVAGHETTATALAWTFRFLLESRACLDELHAEIASSEATNRPDRIGKLDLLDATIKESLRLQPVIPMVGRVTKKPFVVKGWEIPPGNMIAPNIYLVHRRADVYPNPRVFRPRRFLERKPSASEWFPFGGGNRRCIGMAFALYEMKMVVATVLSRVVLRLAPGASVSATRRAITLTPADGLRVVVVDKATRTDGATIDRRTSGPGRRESDARATEA